MAVRFFRLTIKGTDEAKLQGIKDWFDTKIENNDLDEKLGWSTSLAPPDEAMGETEYTFNVDMYIKLSVAMDKYKTIVAGKWSTLNKIGLTSAKLVQYDNCSHDSDKPQPCQPDIRFEWSV